MDTNLNVSRRSHTVAHQAEFKKVKWINKLMNDEVDEWMNDIHEWMNACTCTRKWVNVEKMNTRVNVHGNKKFNETMNEEIVF